MALARERQRKLSETCKAYVLVREAAELAQWIKNKVLIGFFVKSRVFFKYPAFIFFNRSNTLTSKM